MDRPTYNEARPLWRQSGDVETYAPPRMSAAERLARARQAGAPESKPPVTLQTARRLGWDTRSMVAPVQRDQEGAVSHSSAPSPRPAPPPPAEKPPGKQAGKPAGKVQRIYKPREKHGSAAERADVLEVLRAVPRRDHRRGGAALANGRHRLDAGHHHTGVARTRGCR